MKCNQSELEYLHNSIHIQYDSHFWVENINDKLIDNHYTLGTDVGNTVVSNFIWSNFADRETINVTGGNSSAFF